MFALKSLRWTKAGVVIGAVATAGALTANLLAPEKVWPVQILAFVGRFGFWAMRDWYPAHYIDPMPWVSGLGLIAGGALQWASVGFVVDAALFIRNKYLGVHRTAG